MSDTKDPFSDAWNEDMASGAERDVTPAQDAVKAASEAMDSAGKEYAKAWAGDDKVAPADKVTDTSESDTSKKAEPSAFKDAFAKARGEGAKQFEWQGKKYTTEMKAPTKSVKAAPKEDPKVQATDLKDHPMKAPFDVRESAVPDSTKMLTSGHVADAPIKRQEPSKPNQSNEIPIGVKGRGHSKEVFEGKPNNFMGK